MGNTENDPPGDLDALVDRIIATEGRSPTAVRQLVGVLEYELEAADQHLPADHPAREYLDATAKTLRRIRRSF